MSFCSCSPNFGFTNVGSGIPFGTNSRNGEKKWITNGIFADFFTVACRTGKPGVGGISLLLVEKGMEGVECRKMKCSGAWSSGTTYITFDDVKVPKGSSLVI